MNNLKLRFLQWMQGRNGPDALYNMMVGLYFVLVILSLFVRSPLLTLLALTLPILTFYRVFSKNIAKRAAENAKYLQIQGKVKKKILQIKNQWRERHTHRYRTCASCRTTLRMQKKTGDVTVTCPVCQHVNHFHIRF